MKWFTGYWGVEIMAESPEDEKVLRRLVELMPEKPEYIYDDGNIIVGDSPMDFFGNYEGFTVTLER